MQRILEKKHSILVQYLLSYLAVMVFVVSVVLAISRITLQAVRESAYTESLSKIDRVQASLDTHLRGIENFALTVATREDVTAIASVRGDLRPFHHYAVYDLVKELRRYEAADSSWSELYLYFNNEDFVVTSTGRSSAKAFYDSSGYALSYREWLSALNTNYFAGFYNYGEGEGARVEYWLPLSGHSDDYKTGVIVLRIDEATVEALLAGIQWNSDELIAVADHRQLLFHTPFANGQAFFSLQESLDQEENQLVLNGTVVSKARSEVTGWTYLSVLPQSYLIGRTQYLQSIVILCIVLALLFILLFSLFSLRSNYLPLRSIGRLLNAGKEEIPKSGPLEYRAIEQSVRTILADYQTAKQQLDVQRSLMRNNVLVKLLHGSFDGLVSLEDTLTLYEIVFQGEQFLVFTINFQQSRSLEEDFTALPSPDQICRPFVHLLTAGGYSAYGVEAQGISVCILSHSDFSKGLCHIKELAAQGQAILHDRYLLETTISLSSVHSGYGGIAAAYRETAAVTDYSNLLGDPQDTILAFADLLDKEMETDHYPGRVSTLNQLTNLLLTRNFREAKGLFASIAKEIGEADYDVKMGKCLKYSLMNAIAEGISGVQEEGYSSRGKNPVELVIGCESIAQLCERTLSLLDDLTVYYQSQSARHTNELVGEITGFIHSHYQDSALSVTQIADAFGLKVPFLSKFFKKHTGSGLLDYITRHRLGKAKELLLGGDLTLNEIAARTGFINSSALIRTFKRYEGITPGKYKEAHQPPD